MEKYIITDDFSTVYNSREEAKAAFQDRLNSIKDAMKRATFKFFYHVAPFYE